ncbi:MAG: amidohydrolase family protein [Bacteroidetes bacterium]|nr:amidohydrolase family protein [Bacteroidota bacterium]MBX7046691.1 amidohydrolase family protein [Ignavibacteria bacterium]
MKIIDAHIHIGKWSEIFLNLSTTVDEAVNEMKKSGIDEAVCMPTDRTSNGELFAEVKNRKDFKFYFNAWINPLDESLGEFLEKNLKEISFFKIHPSIDKRKITDGEFEKYLEIASDNKIPVVVHCGRWKEMAGYEICLEAAKKFPALRLILAHLGGDQPAICTQCAKDVRDGGFENVYLGTESVREFYFVNEVVKTLGAEKIIFGSDYNLGLPASYLPIIDRLQVSNEEKELIYSGNALRLINKL